MVVLEGAVVAARVVGVVDVVGGALEVAVIVVGVAVAAGVRVIPADAQNLVALPRDC